MANPNPAGFTGFPYGIGAPGLATMAVTNQLTLPQTATKTLFTITGGPINVLMIVGVVTVAIGAVANATKLTATPTLGGSATDICATVDINGAAAGDVFWPNNSFATAAILSTAGVIVNKPGLTAIAIQFFMTAGTIAVNCAGSDGGTGMMKWHLWYVPLNVGLQNAGLVTVTMPTS